jgi:hypothetical protein
LFIYLTAAPAAAGNIPVIALIIVLTTVTWIYLFIRFNKPLLEVLSRVFPDALFNKIVFLNRELIDGMLLFRSSRQVLVSSVLLLGSWMTIAVIFYLVSWPFLEVLHLPVYAPLVLMIFSAISLAVPSGPGAIGTMHFAFLAAINLMTGGQFDINTAAGLIVVLHFFVTLFDFMVGGALYGLYSINGGISGRR